MISIKIIMRKYNIITIGRQYASGGREIGEIVSKQLGIPLYNKEILNLAAERLDVNPDDIEYVDEVAASSLLYSISMMTGLSTNNNLPLNDKLFIEERDIIKNLASKGACIIVGRCADNVLGAIRNDCLKIFIYSDQKSREKRAIEKYGIDPKEVKNVIKKHDKKRFTYYNLNTGERWGAKENYDLCINSDALGIKLTAELIVKIYNSKSS